MADEDLKACARAIDRVLGDCMPDREPEEESTPEKSEVRVRVIPAINWDEQPLGKIPDTWIARKLGVSEVAVGKQRRKRGIKPYSKHNKESQREPGQRAGINWDEQPLGEVPDYILARKLGVDPSSVRCARIVREKRREKLLKVKDEMDRPRTPIPEPVERPSHRPERCDIVPERHERPRKKVEPILPSWPYVQQGAQEARQRPKPPDLPRVVDVVIESTGPQPGAHLHRCPICRDDTMCGDPDCEAKLETVDGELYLFDTCDQCIQRLSKESTGEMIPVGGRFGGSSRGGLGSS